VASSAEAAGRHGVRIRQGVEVKALRLQGDRVVGAVTNEGRYNCKTVILATGPWAARLAQEIGIALPVQACRTQVAPYRRPADFGRPCPVYGDFVQGLYFKPTHGEMLHAGSIAGEEVDNAVDPDEYKEAANGTWLIKMRQRLSWCYPSMHRGYG